MFCGHIYMIICLGNKYQVLLKNDNDYSLQIKSKIKFLKYLNIIYKYTV